MATGAVSTKRTLRLCSLLEFAGAPRIDRERGIIYGVRVIGTVSENRRRYLPEALAVARRLYEGKVINLDHPDRPEKTRSANDPRAWLENVESAADGGLTGDLHFLNPQEELAIRVMNAAEQNPRIYGLSHNAEGRGYTDSDGVFVVEEITEVRSVDLVTDPATTRGLFEEKAMSVTFRQFLETRVLPRAKKAGKPALKLVRFLEALDDKDTKDTAIMDGAMCEADDPLMADAAATGGDWKTDLTSCIGKLVQGDDPDSHAMADKILKMIKPKAAAVEEGEGEEEEETEEGTEEPEEDDKDKKKPFDESRRRPRTLGQGVRELREEVRQLREEKTVADLKTFCRAEADRRKLPLSESLQKTLLVLRDRKAITSHLDDIKALLSHREQAPRSGFRGGTQPVTEAKKPADAKTFASQLRLLSAAN